MDRGAWRDTVHGVQESDVTWRVRPHTHTLFCSLFILIEIFESYLYVIQYSSVVLFFISFLLWVYTILFISLLLWL